MAPDDMRPITTQRGGVSGSQRLLQRYEALAGISRAMLVAARANDWAQIDVLQAQCAQLIEELKAAQKQECLALNEQWQRIALLRSILADDAEIRDRSEPWLAQLEKLVPGGPTSGSRAQPDADPPADPKPGPGTG